MRLFVALDIESENVARTVLKTQEVIRRLGVRATYVDPSLLHITLRFIGEVDDSLVEEIVDRLASVKAGVCSIRVGGVGAFPSLERPRVVFIGVEPDENLITLQRQVVSVLRGIGQEDNKPFKPHITVARIKQFIRLGPRDIDLLSSISVDETVVIRSFRLKSSVLTPRGPIYRTVKEFPLG